MAKNEQQIQTFYNKQNKAETRHLKEIEANWRKLKAEQKIWEENLRDSNQIRARSGIRGHTNSGSTTTTVPTTAAHALVQHVARHTWVPVSMQIHTEASLTIGGVVVQLQGVAALARDPSATGAG